MSDPKNCIRRILNIIPYVQKHPGVHIDDLARYCGAKPKEVLSDLDKILLCGVPPYLPDDYIGVYVDGGHVEVRFADHFRRPIRFTPTEALALLLAIESMPEGHEGHAEAKDSLQKKIRALLSRSLAAGGAVGDRIDATAGTGPSQGALPARRRLRSALTTLQSALDQGRAVEVDYYSASKDETRARVLEPYGLVEQGGDHYLVARSRDASRVFSFRVDRVREARILEDRYEMPARFSLERHVKKKMDFEKGRDVWARVRIGDERIQRWLAETRAGDVERTPSGDAVVTVRAYERTWLINEVCSWGPDVEVLEPPEIREAIAQHLRAMAARAKAGPEPAGAVA